MHLTYLPGSAMQKKSFELRSSHLRDKKNYQRYIIIIIAQCTQYGSLTLASAEHPLNKGRWKKALQSESSIEIQFLQ